MTCSKKTRRAWAPGAMVAGVAVAALLAGCGGGGGGGGGSSPSNPPSGGGGGGGGTPQQPEVLKAGPVSVSAGSGATSVGSIAGGTPEVDIPAGTAPATAISVSISTDPNAPALPSGYSVASAVYDIQPSGAQFGGTGITIKLPYPASTANAAFLLVYYYDAPSGTWQPVQIGGRPSSTTDTTNLDVAAQTTQIAAGRTNGSGPADYVILGPPTPPSTPM